MENAQATDVKGIDLSHHNTITSWNQIKQAGYQFITAKCTEGTDFHDPMFPTFAQQTKGLFDFGGYHFAHPECNEPEKEAQFFYNTLIQYRPDGGELIPVLDLEEPATAGTITGDEIVKWVKAFLAEWQKISNNLPIMIYTAKWYCDQYQIADKDLSQLPLWCADYDDFAEDFGGWDKWEEWQTTGNGNVPGVSGDCDIDRAVSLNAIRIHPANTEAINKIIALLGTAYNIADDPAIKEKLHENANELRSEAGEPTT